MNREFIEKLIANIENPSQSSRPGLGFNMGCYLQPVGAYINSYSLMDCVSHGLEHSNWCGTNACIAGHAILMSPEFVERIVDGKYWTINDHTDAKNLMGLTVEQADALFYGGEIGTDRIGDNRAWAVRCLRKLLETGVVDWEGTEHA